jgi:transmembrane sensor
MGARATVLQGGVTIDRESAVARTAVEMLDAGGVAAIGSLSGATTSIPRDWPSGMLVFRDAPMRNAIAEVNRYARKPIRFDGETGRLRVSATFHAADTAGFARSLAAAFDLAFKDRTDAYVLSRQAAVTPPK